MAQAQTNALGNCIKRLLGIRNLTWEELAKFGVNRKDAKRIGYKKKDETAQISAGAKKAEAVATGEKKDYWTSEFKGQTYLNAKAGGVFPVEFLVGLGMKESKTKGLYYTSREVEGCMAELVKMEEFAGKKEVL